MVAENVLLHFERPFTTWEKRRTSVYARANEMDPPVACVETSGRIPSAPRRALQLKREESAAKTPVCDVSTKNHRALERNCHLARCFQSRER